MANPQMIHEKLTYQVIGAFFEVYNTLGLGFLEHVYMNALELELTWRGHRVDREVFVTVTYKGFEVGRQRLDMVVDDVLLIEGKSSYKLPERATRQLYNYLRATTLDVALLLHFGPDPQFFRNSSGIMSSSGQVSRRALLRLACFCGSVNAECVLTDHPLIPAPAILSMK